MNQFIEGSLQSFHVVKLQIAIKQTKLFQYKIAIKCNFLLTNSLLEFNKQTIKWMYCYIGDISSTNSQMNVVQL